jgi:hypothetical protein
VPIELAQRLVALGGKVRDERGTPIAGARVAVRLAPDASELRSVLSDSRGAFEMMVLDGNPVEVSIQRPGFIEANLRTDPTRSLDVLLERGRALRVRLDAPSGSDLSRARVEVRSLDGSPSELASRCLGPGLFEVFGRLSGRYHASVAAGNLRLEGVLEADDVELTLAVPATGCVEATWLLPELDPAANLTGIVLESSAEGVPELQHQFFNTLSGTHRFTPVIPGEYELRLRALTEDGEVVWARRAVTVAAGATTSVVLDGER